MKKHLLYGICTVVFSLTACQKEAVSGLESETGMPILFTSEGLPAETVTKAPTPVTTLSTFGVVCTSGQVGSETSKWNISSVTPSGTTYETGKFWPLTDPGYHFYAANVPLTFAAAGTTVAPAGTDTDIVTAYLAAPTFNAPNKLTFQHIFARIGTCNVSAPSEYTVSGLTVKMTPKIPDTGCTYNLRTGAWTKADKSDTEKTLCTATGSTVDNNIWLVPGEYTLTASYTLTKGDYTQAFTKTAKVTVAAGKVNHIKATLPSGNAAEITFTVEVTAWTVNTITATFN